MPTTVWKGYLRFGLVSFPVRLFTAARADTVHFHMLHKKDQSRVKEVWYCVQEDKPIDRTDIEKGYEIGKGRYVVVEDEKLKKIAPPTATTMDILRFVDSDEVDPIYFEASYYLAADDRTAEPYVLFLAALKATKRCSRQGRDAQPGARRAESAVNEGGVVLRTLYYPDELHKANRSEPPKEKYSAKELELARVLSSI